MTAEPSFTSMVAHALADPAIVEVSVAERFEASTAEVARMRIAYGDGRSDASVIGKRARGAGHAAARRERWFFEHAAPRWACPAPRLLGALDIGDELVLVLEDLTVAGYAPRPTEITEGHVRCMIDMLVAMHARLWGALTLLDDSVPANASVTRAAQAWPPSAIGAHAAAVDAQSTAFVAEHAAALTAGERALLAEVLHSWAPRFHARAGTGRSLTWIHADFHIYGNILFAGAADALQLRVIDWSECKPGLGPHDLVYCLAGIACPDRKARDVALLRSYWDGLRSNGITEYAWETCKWDYQFSLFMILFQSLFQNSLFWFRRTVALIDELDAMTALRSPPP